MPRLVIGQRYIVNTWFPAAFKTDNTDFPFDEPIRRPLVIDSVRKLDTFLNNLSKQRANGGGGRCYEAEFMGLAPDGSPQFKAVSRLRLSSLDEMETTEGNAADLEGVTRFVMGESETALSRQLSSTPVSHAPRL